jgi:hypothetical protein
MLLQSLKANAGACVNVSVQIITSLDKTAWPAALLRSWHTESQKKRETEVEFVATVLDRTARNAEQPH